MAAQTEFKKGNASFRLVGMLRVNDRSFSLNKKSSSGFISNQAYIGVDCGEGNVVHARMFDGYMEGKQKSIYVHGKKYDENYKRDVDNYSDSFQISWDDRFSPRLLDKVGPSCFTTVGLERTINAEKKEEIDEMKFLSQYDAIQYINDVLYKIKAEERNNLVVDVRGSIQYNFYEGKVTPQKTITSIKLSNAPKEKFSSKFIQTCYINKDNIGEFDPVSNTQLITARVPEYISKVDGIEVKRTVPLRQSMHLDLSIGAMKTLLKWFKKEDQYGRYVLIGKFSDIGSTETVDLSNYSDDVRELLKSGDWDEEESNPTVSNNNSASEDMIITNIKTANVDDNGIQRKVVVREPNIYTVPELEGIYTDFINVINPPETDEMPFESDDDSDDDWMAAFDSVED